MNESKQLNSTYWVLRITFGAVPFLAGLDKFFNLLTHWDKYMSPTAQAMLPVSATTFLHIAGLIEMAVGIAILTRWTRVGSYVASVWLVGIALNLLLAGYFDVAVRDAVMAVSVFSLARLTEIREAVNAPAGERLRQQAIAAQQAV